jgi:hypothetical protein
MEPASTGSRVAAEYIAPAGGGAEASVSSCVGPRIARTHAVVDPVCARFWGQPGVQLVALHGFTSTPTHHTA